MKYEKLKSIEKILYLLIIIQKYAQVNINDDLKIEFYKNTDMKSWCIRSYRFKRNNKWTHMGSCGCKICKSLRKINNDTIVQLYTFNVDQQVTKFHRS